MKLPHVEQAVVAREKVVEYLLNPLHADGAPKARFFTTLGFQVEEWEELAAALRRVAEMYHVSKRVESVPGGSILWLEPWRRPVGARRGSEPSGSSIMGAKSRDWSPRTRGRKNDDPS